MIDFYSPTTSVTHLLEKKEKHAEGEDPEARTGINRKYELCRTAANHVASLGEFSASGYHTTDFLSLAAFYQETYLLERSPPLVVYYLFSSSILLDFDGVFILFLFGFCKRFVSHVECSGKESKRSACPRRIHEMCQRPSFDGSALAFSRESPCSVYWS